MKFIPSQHIVGKVYDLTQENMNAMIDEIELLRESFRQKETEWNAERDDYKQAVEVMAATLSKWESDNPTYGLDYRAREALNHEAVKRVLK